MMMETLVVVSIGYKITPQAEDGRSRRQRAARMLWGAALRARSGGFAGGLV